MKLIIIAAGQGSRIRSVTDGIPKTLLRLKGKSLLDRVLENAASVGIKEAVVVTGYRSPDLVSYIDNHKFEINEDTQMLLNLELVLVILKLKANFTPSNW